MKTQLNLSLLAITFCLPANAAEFEYDFSTPAAAAYTHQQALMTRDLGVIGNTMIFPFTQIQPDGGKQHYGSLEEYSAEGVPFYNEVETATEISSLNDLSVVEIIVRVHDLDRRFLFRAKVVWGMIKIDDDWKVSWRHFMGRTQ